MCTRIQSLLLAPQRRLDTTSPPAGAPEPRSVPGLRLPKQLASERLLQTELMTLQAEQQRALQWERNRAVKAEAAAQRAKQLVDAETNKRFVSEARERAAVKRAHDEAKAFAEREGLLRRELRGAVALCEEMRATELRRSSALFDPTGLAISPLPQSASDARVSESQRAALQEQVAALQGQVRRLKAELQAATESERKVPDAETKVEQLLQAQLEELGAELRERTDLARHFAEQVQQMERRLSPAPAEEAAQARFEARQAGTMAQRVDELVADNERLRLQLAERGLGGESSAKAACVPFEELPLLSPTGRAATPVGVKMVMPHPADF